MFFAPAGATRRIRCGACALLGRAVTRRTQTHAQPAQFGRTMMLRRVRGVAIRVGTAAGSASCRGKPVSAGGVGRGSNAPYAHISAALHGGLVGCRDKLRFSARGAGQRARQCWVSSSGADWGATGRENNAPMRRSAQSGVPSCRHGPRCGAARARWGAQQVYRIRLCRSMRACRTRLLGARAAGRSTTLVRQRQRWASCAALAACCMCFGSACDMLRDTELGKVAKLLRRRAKVAPMPAASTKSCTRLAPWRIERQAFAV